MAGDPKMMTVRLTVEHMKPQVLNAIQTFYDQHEVALDSAVREVFDRFDFRVEIEKIVQDQLRLKLRETVERAVVEALRASESSMLGFVKRAVDKAVEEDVEVHLTSKPRRR